MPVVGGDARVIVISRNETVAVGEISVPKKSTLIYTSRRNTDERESGSNPQGLIVKVVLIPSPIMLKLSAEVISIPVDEGDLLTLFVCGKGACAERDQQYRDHDSCSHVELLSRVNRRSEHQHENPEFLSLQSKQ